MALAHTVPGATRGQKFSRSGYSNMIALSRGPACARSRKSSRCTAEGRFITRERSDTQLRRDLPLVTSCERLFFDFRAADLRNPGFHILGARWLELKFLRNNETAFL